MTTAWKRFVCAFGLLSSVALTAGGAETGPVAEAGVGTMKWNPGHYVKFEANASDEEIGARLEETKDLPFVKGIVVRHMWNQLETEKGVYDFRRLDRHLNLAAAKGKRVFVLLTTKGFNGGKAIPDYLRVPFYEGGAFKTMSAKGKWGENVALWNDNVRFRLVLLVKELASRYDSRPNLEGVIFNETAFGQPVDEITEEQRAGYYTNLIHVDTEARKAFKQTVVIQYINFPAPRTPPIVENMLAKGIGFGAPDVFLDDEDLEEGVYPYNDLVQGKIPIGMQIESDSLLRYCFSCEPNPPPVRDLYLFARDRLHSNYIFWDYFQKDYYRAWDKILAMFKAPDFPKNSTGGLIKTCPSKFASCITGGK